MSWLASDLNANWTSSLSLIALSIQVYWHVTEPLVSPLLFGKQTRPSWLRRGRGGVKCSLPPQSNLCPPVMAVTNAAPASPCWSAGGVSVNQQTLCIILCVRCWCRCEHPSLTCLFSSPRDTSQLLVNTLIVTVKDVLENRRRTNTQHPEHRGNRSLQ